MIKEIIHLYKERKPLDSTDILPLSMQWRIILYFERIDDDDSLRAHYKALLAKGVFTKEKYESTIIALGL